MVEEQAPVMLDNGKPAIKGPRAVEAVATMIETQNRFISINTSDRSSVWIYREESGIWVPEGRSVIRQAATFLTQPPCSKHFANEVVSLIQRKYWISSKRLGGLRHKIVTANGTLNLDDITFSQGFEPDEYHIATIPAEYDPEAEAPKFSKFLEEILPYEPDRLAILEYFGYCLYKSYPYAYFPILIGEGANGKSTLLEVLKLFLGSENCSGVTPQQLSMNRFSTAQLHGKLANIAADIPKSALDAEVIKMLTGGDLLTAEHKNKDQFHFVNYAKLIFSCNTLPKTYDDSAAFYRRVRQIHFPNTFEAGDRDTIQRNVLITSLTTPSELSGILNLALEGWKRLRSQGNFTGDLSIGVKKEDYARESDTVKYFAMKYLKARVTASPTPKPWMYQFYQTVCQDIGKVPKHDRVFAKELRRYAPYIDERQTIVGGQKVRVWVGVELDSEAFNKILYSFSSNQADQREQDSL